MEEQPTQQEDAVQEVTFTQVADQVPKDLTITFDDGAVVETHSLILLLASSKFRKLLTSDNGSLVKSLTLHERSSKEFTQFQEALMPASRPLLTDPTIHEILSRWAHEFDVEALRTLCEDYLLKSVVVSEASLAYALKFGLERRVTQCIAEYRLDLPRFAEALSPLAVSARPELLELWPLLCDAAGVERFEMPTDVATMWPFVAAAVRKQGSVTKALQTNIKIKSEQAVEEIKKAVVGAGGGDILESAQSYASSVYNSWSTWTTTRLQWFMQ